MNTLNLKTMISAVLLVLPTAGYSTARPDFAQEPLFIGSAVEPNLIFMHDDSGSMSWEYMPDNLEYDNDIQSSKGDRYYQDGIDAVHRYYYSSKVNKVWFNPNVTYSPPLQADGTGSLPSSSYASAPRNGYDSNSDTNNLNNRFSISEYNVEGGGFYWVFNSSASCDANPKQNSCYSHVSVNGLSATEQTNFANWYSYYNTRVKSSRAGISAAFYDLPSTFRLGWGRLNNGTNTIDGASNIRAVHSGVRGYTTARREEFLDWLYSVPASGGTPLERALEGVGRYYERSASAWTDNPGQSVSAENPERECRLAYTILMSDGYYNQTSANMVTSEADDLDGAIITNPEGTSFQYVPTDPFKDGRPGRTLADVAMYYWKRDLRTDVGNYVPTSEKNPAFWQHMSTYAVGLGVQGTIDPASAFDAIVNGTAIDWWGGNNDQDKINDMLHAAVNGRGGFFSAADPDSFAVELAEVVADIVAEAGSASAVEFDVSSFQQDALIFASQFDPNGWTGDLKAAKLGGTDVPVVPNMDEAIENGDGWSARAILDDRDLAADDRLILTYGSNGAKGFLWDKLTEAQKDDLRYGGVGDTIAEQRLNFIRGDTSLEGTTGWRLRGSRLGSIVNSSPEFVGTPRASWPDTAPFGTSSKRFSTFAAANVSRTPVVYTGSNDGMLHGFKGTFDGGNEVLAYIPEFVYDSSTGDAGLHFLTDPAYQHRYYVDLEIRQQDIFTRGKKADGTLTTESDWRSIIVGGGRSGAKGIFALDVTDPTSFSEADAEKTVLWEFTGSNNSKLGNITQVPVIGMTLWGAEKRWTAFVANGHNSDTGSTGFFMLDIEGGMDGTWNSADVRYVEFESGGDGLSPLTALDTTGDFLIDRVYAGDLDGKLWAASVNNSGDWATVYGTEMSPEPLFTAGTDQPITAAPAVAANREMVKVGNMPNLMIYFGTGQYLATADVGDTTTQSVYGVWDRGSFGLNRSNLEPRTISTGKVDLDVGTSADVRYSAGNDIDFSVKRGWRFDLPASSGERAVVSPQVRGKYVYLNTMIPDPNPCLGGGRGWLMAFGLDGQTPNDRAFLEFPTKVAGYKSSGLPGQSTILGNFRFTPGSNKDDPVDVASIPPLSSAVGNAGRRGWNELIKE